MSFFDTLLWYNSDFLVELASFLMEEPFIYIVALAILFYVTGIIKRLMSV